MEGILVLAFIIAALALLDVLALRLGVDSRPESPAAQRLTRMRSGV